MSVTSSFDTSEPELYEHLKSCVVGEVRIFVDRNGLPSIGFVAMKREQDAIAVIEKLNGTALSSTAARSPSRSRTGSEGYAMEDDSPLITPDALLPSQFADLQRSSNGPDAPIKRLMREMLELALRDATGVARSPQPERRNKKWEAQRLRSSGEHAASAIDWIFDDSDGGVFSFVNVCDELGIDGEALRARVRAEKQAA